MSARPKLPYVDFTKWAGLNTKTSEDVLPEQQLKIAQNVDFFTRYGAVSKPPGMSRILSEIYKEAGITKPISWVGFYKAADLDGQFLRHTLIAAGTTIQRVEPNGSITSLATGRRNNRVHSADQFGEFLLIQNQNPELIGDGDVPVKYDGTDITNWGIVAPGTEETDQEEFDDASSFTVVGGTAVNETVTTRDGSAVKVDKTTTTATDVSIQKTLDTAFSANASGEDKVFVWLFIPRGQITNFATSGRSVSVYLGSDSDLVTNFYRFDFTIGDLAEGWNLLIMDTSTAPTGEDGTSSGAFNNSIVKTLRFEAISKTGATLITGLRWDLLFTTDEGRLTAAISGSSGKLTGVYKYKVTYSSKFGHESNAGATSISIEPSSKKIDLTNIPVSPDPQVIARRIYRTVASGNIFLFLTRIADNETTTFEDNTADIALGSIQPPVAGSVNLDASPPPKAVIVKTWKRTVFLAGDPSAPDTVFFSEDNTPESFPVLNAVQLDDIVTAMYETLSGLVIETATGKWQIIGDNPDFKFDKVIDGIGCVGHRAAGEARLAGWAIDEDGMYLYDLNEPVKISEPIRDQFDAINRANIAQMWSAHLKSRNAIVVFAKDANGRYTDNLVYQYLQDVQTRGDLLNGWWWRLDLPTEVNLIDGREIEDENGDFHLYVGSEEGMLFELFDTDEKNWLDAEGNKKVITTIFQTKFVRPGDAVNPPATDAHMEGTGSGRVEPRWIEVRKRTDDISTWTALLETADGPVGPVRDSQTVEVDFKDAEKTLRRVAVRAFTGAEYMRVTLTNAELDVENTITGVRVYFHIREGQFEV